MKQATVKVEVDGETKHYILLTRDEFNSYVIPGNHRAIDKENHGIVEVNYMLIPNTTISDGYLHWKPLRDCDEILELIKTKGEAL